MRITRRLTPITCGLVILVAALGVVALAQGRSGPAATNSFYRFNYNLDEMQPIAYPPQPIVTQHQITLQRETIRYTAHVGFMPIRNATTGVARATFSTSTTRRTA